MFSLIPIAFFIFLFIIFKKSKCSSSWRDSFLSASVIWGLLLTAITEFLSAFRLISFLAILGVWVISAILAFIYSLRIKGITKSNETSYMRLRLAGISNFDILLLACIIIIIITIGVIGWISPPNTWDSMTYHMSRVMHWIQNRSIAFYPTNILRQLHQNPWAEYAIMHFQILSNSDRLANFIQWFSMAGAAIGVSLIAKKFGSNLRGQIYSAIFSVTIPMGILQGSSTQTDYVVSFWLVCFIYFLILLIEKGKYLYSLAVGASLGLAILTKATAYIYAFPFIVWLGLSPIIQRHIKRLWPIALVGVIVITINIGHYSRNYDLYSNPLGPGQEGEGYKYSNDIVSIASVTSTTIRNLGLHFGTPFSAINTFSQRGVYYVHNFIGIDTNDPRTTWAGTKFKVKFSKSEDNAGNFLHLCFIITTSIIFIFKQPKQNDILYYIMCLLVAALLFSTYLKWQPWNSRLHLPLFILYSPLIGLSLSRFKFPNIANFLAAILLISALPFLLQNKSRPLIGNENILTSNRTELYFKINPYIIDPYTSSVQFVIESQCKEIGLILEQDDWEYPFWVLLHKNTKEPIRIEHVRVENISEKYNRNHSNTFTPCAIIMVSKKLPIEVNVGNIFYSQKSISGPVGVFTQK